MAKRVPNLYDGLDFPDFVQQDYPKLLHKWGPDGELQSKQVDSPSEERAAVGWSDKPGDKKPTKAE